jgi:hypothetical protein
MSAPPQLSLAAMSTSPMRVATQVPLASEGTEDLYAVWKLVFERVRAVEVSRDEAYSRAADWQDFQVSDPDGHASLDHARDPHDPHNEARPPAVLGIHHPSSGPVGAAPLVANARTGDIANVARDSFASATLPVAALRNVNGTAAVQAQISESLAAPQSASKAAARIAVAPAQPASAELVNVFVQGAAVAIVVRDMELSAEEALHCAFATARELIGERAALAQLTLNGRTVYQRDVGESDPMHRFEQCESLLVFAC